MAEFRIRQIKPGRPAESGDELDSMLSELLASDADPGPEGTTEEEHPELTIPVEDTIALLSQSLSKSEVVSESVSSDEISNEPSDLLDQMRAELLETESEAGGKASLEPNHRTGQGSANAAAHPDVESPMADMLSELLSETAERPNAYRLTLAQPTLAQPMPEQAIPAQVEQEGREDTTEEELPTFTAVTAYEAGNILDEHSEPEEFAIRLEEAIASLSPSETVSSDQLSNKLPESELHYGAGQVLPAYTDAAASADMLFEPVEVADARDETPTEESPRGNTLSKLLSETLPSETQTERPDTRVEQEGREEQKTTKPAAIRELDELIAAIDDDARNTPFDTEVRPVELRHIEEKTSRCVIFSLASTKYAMPIGDVIETDKVPRITAVPNMPPFVRGISNLRGDIISVLDLGVLLGLEYSEQVEHARILVVRGGVERTLTAFVVDDVKGMASVSEKQITQVAGQIEDRVVPVLRGVFEHEDQLVNLLNVERLFASEELQKLEFA